MNHNYVCKFHSFDCIDEVVDIDDASFDKERMRQYILSSNNDVDKLNIFSKFCFYNYKITTQKELDKIFNDCLEYIFKYIKENLKDCN